MKKNKQKIKKTNFFTENLSESLDYIKESKNFIYFVLLLFVLFILIGFFISAPEFIVEEIREMLKNLLEKTSQLNGLELMFFIFFNNFGVALFSLSLGIILGIIPFILTLVNGYIIGFVSRLAVNEAGISSLFMLLPHGIFELPAALISFALGIKLGTSLFLSNPDKEFFRRVKKSIKTLFFIILPLLIIAAIIEGSLIFFFK